MAMLPDEFERLREQLGAGATSTAAPLVAFVVDDEKGMRRLVSYALREARVETEDHASILSMIGGLARRHPDVIFLDISLDGADAIDGFRVLEEQRFIGHVQLMSGRDHETLERVKRAGEQRNLRMLPVLQKPFRVEAVSHAIQQLVAGRLTQPVLGQATAPAPQLVRPTIDLWEALRRGWLELWYQPKVDLQRKALSGAEGLIRARHPVHGVLSPASFLPGAEESALLELTEFVVAQALRDWHVLARSGHPMPLAVNAPVNALTKISIGSLVKEHGPKSPRWPGLILEVTEDQIVSDIPLVQEIATQLSLYKVGLAIDDFGTGYSSFARLREFPFCELKLDRSFVHHCASDPTNQSICETVIDLAHRFGTKAVAEGIETRAELQALHKMGCDVGQGFLLAKPMPKEELSNLLLRSPTPRVQNA